MLVGQSIDGLLASSAGVDPAWLASGPDNRGMLASELNSSCVAIVSAAGHEPEHAGFVGPGMLSLRDRSRVLLWRYLLRLRYAPLLTNLTGRCIGMRS